MIDLVQTLRHLATSRPIFHSEADFQHALAWQIHQQHPETNIRLEYRPHVLERKLYVDIWIEVEGVSCAIELKYKTRKLNVTVDGGSFDLLDQGAQDLARYDFCKDISRIETLAKSYQNLRGYAVFLTNDSSYWQKGSRSDTVDSAFRIHQDRVLGNRMCWLPHASKGTTKGRESPIEPSGKYTLSWQDYSSCGDDRNAGFRLLIVGIPSLQL